MSFSFTASISCTGKLFPICESTFCVILIDLRYPFLSAVALAISLLSLASFLLMPAVTLESDVPAAVAASSASLYDSIPAVARLNIGDSNFGIFTDAIFLKVFWNFLPRFSTPFCAFSNILESLLTLLSALPVFKLAVITISAILLLLIPFADPIECSS